MKKLETTLIKEIGNQRFYKLNQYLTKGYSLTGDVDIEDELKSSVKDFKEEYRQFAPLKCNVICVSDATTHSERLVFAGFEYHKDGEDKVSRTQVQIAGVHTMMIYGGDPSSMKGDLVYVRQLAKMNGYSFTQHIEQI